MSNQEIIREYLFMLKTYTLPEREKLPELDLYMDQVLTYITKITSFLDEENQMTGSMINNYVKGEIIPSPQAKKYNAEHLSKILSILFLKPILSMSEIKLIFDSQQNSEDAYLFLKKTQKETFTNVASFAENELKDVELNDREEIQKLATKLAVNAYANKLIAEKLLQLLKETDETEKKNSEKEEKKKKKKKADDNEEMAQSNDQQIQK